MIEFKSFQIFLILMIQFTAAVTQHRSFITVRVGDETTLPCEDVKDYQDRCFSRNWIFTDLTTGPAVTLFEDGQIHRKAAAKSDRLSVTEKCSLVIKKVTDEDAGRYNCRQCHESGQCVTYSDVFLTVINTVTKDFSKMTVRVGDEATLPCEDDREYQNKCLSATWSFNYKTTGTAVTLFEYGKIHRQAASKSDRLSVTEKCSLVIKKVTYEDAGHFTCRQFDELGTEVTNYGIDLSLVNRDDVATRPPQTTTTKLPRTTTKRRTKATTRPTTSTKRTTKATTRPTTAKATIKISTKATSRPTATDSAATDLPAILIPVAVFLAALLIIVIRWKRAKGNNTQLDVNNADPPDVVSYASIRYKKTNSKARVRCEDDTVTYSTVNTSSTSGRASTDPRNLYASINKMRT